MVNPRMGISLPGFFTDPRMGISLPGIFQVFLDTDFLPMIP